MFVLGQYQTTRGATPKSTQTNCNAATPWKNRQTTTRQHSVLYRQTTTRQHFVQTGRQQPQQFSGKSGRQQQRQLSGQTGRQQLQQQLSGQTFRQTACCYVKWLAQWQERKRFSNEVKIFWCWFCHSLKGRSDWRDSSWSSSVQRRFIFTQKTADLVNLISFT